MTSGSTLGFLGIRSDPDCEHPYVKSPWILFVLIVQTLLRTLFTSLGIALKLEICGSILSFPAPNFLSLILSFHFRFGLNLIAIPLLPTCRISCGLSFFRWIVWLNRNKHHDFLSISTLNNLGSRIFTPQDVLARATE